MSHDAPIYSAPEDPYAFARCACDHLIYADAKPGEGCLWCPCPNHVPASLPPQGGEPS